MTIRTTSVDVIAVLGDDYGPKADGTLINLTPYMTAASALVDRAVSCATAKGVSLSTSEQELIERWVSAHLYTKTDPIYASRSTGGASGSFVSNPKEPERYKDVAIILDYSGCTSAILNRNFATGYWIGYLDANDNPNTPRQDP